MEQKLVAKIVAARSLQGQVKIQIFTDRPGERFKAGTEYGDLVIHKFINKGNIPVLKLKGIDSREAAEALIGRELFGDADIEKDRFYPEQLLDFAVNDLDGKRLGKVYDVIMNPHQTQLEIKTPDGESKLLPFVTALVPEVNPDSRTIVVNNIEGLI